MSEQTTNKNVYEKVTETVSSHNNKNKGDEKTVSFTKFTVFIRGSSIKIVSTGLYQKDFETWRRNYDRSPDVTTLLMEYQSRFPKATEIYINVLSQDVDLLTKKPLSPSKNRRKA